jgi:hypothetical protein
MPRLGAKLSIIVAQPDGLTRGRPLDKRCQDFRYAGHFRVAN